MRKSKFETPSEQPPETSPEEWEALLGETPEKKPYAFGDIYDEKDTEHDLFLCPVCRKKSINKKPDLKSMLAGDLKLTCRTHVWVYDSKTNTVEDLNKKFNFESE